MTAAAFNLTTSKKTMNQTRVLVVDDHDMFTEMATFVLSAAGYQVEAATDAATALEKIANFFPDQS